MLQAESSQSWPCQVLPTQQKKGRHCASAKGQAAMRRRGNPSILGCRHKVGMHRALEVRIKLLDHVHPQAAGPLHAALLQEQDQPAQQSTCHSQTSLSACTIPSAFAAEVSGRTDLRRASLHAHASCSASVSPVWRCCLGLHHCQDVIWGAFPFSLPCLQCSSRPSAGFTHKAVLGAQCRVAITMSPLLAALRSMCASAMKGFLP